MSDIYSVQLSSSEYYNHDPYICQRSRSKVETDGRTDGGDCIASRANAVGNKNATVYNHVLRSQNIRYSGPVYSSG